MKNNILKAGLCLAAIAGVQVQAADQNNTADVTLVITSNSQLTTGNITFTSTDTALTGTQSYWSQAQNWTFSSTDANGYTVTITTSAGPDVTSWDMTSGANTIAFVLVTDFTNAGIAAPAITGAAGVNPTAVSTLGGRIVTPNTTPSPSENILFDKSATDTTNYTYQIFAAIDQAAMATPIEGNYNTDTRYFSNREINHFLATL